jgi:hypothetical protein
MSEKEKRGEYEPEWYVPPAENKENNKESDGEDAQEKEVGATIIEAVSKIEEKDGGDPIISSTVLKDCKAWFGNKKDAITGFWKENEEKLQEWQKENPKKAELIDYSIASGRVGFILVCKLIINLFKFVYEASTNKGKVKDAFHLGYDPFVPSNKGDKK